RQRTNRGGGDADERAQREDQSAPALNEIAARISRDCELQEFGHPTAAGSFLLFRIFIQPLHNRTLI
ncbi:MAG TPA: hypothetical protein VE154_07530, partial [Chthoniobacterales bacterium]|nr:hypothetical protein [Chthoniobacterales bacterium]